MLDLIAEGSATSASRRALHSSGKTVSNHISSVFAELYVADRAQAIVTAREAGPGRGRRAT